MWSAVVLVVYGCFVVQGHDWEVIQKVKGYGDNITLFCLIDQCCQKNSGWDKYNPNRISIYLEVRGIHSEPYHKYSPATRKNGFSLTIRNLTEEDINIYYSCTYGFEESRPKLLTEKLAFLAPEWEVFHNVNKYGQNLTLICPVEDCCTDEPAWQAKIKNKEIVYMNVSNSSISSSKYVTEMRGTGFTLTILNLRKEDMNTSYRCLYGLRESDWKPLWKMDVFRNETTVAKDEEEMVAIIIGCIVGAVAIFVVVVAVVYFLRRYKQRNVSRHNTTNTPDSGEELQPLSRLKIKLAKKSLTVKCGSESVTLKCTVTGTYSNITWRKKRHGKETDVDISRSDKYQICSEDDPSLIILNITLSDEATYFLIATNDSTTASSKISLTVSRDITDAVIINAQEDTAEATQFVLDMEETFPDLNINIIMFEHMNPGKSILGTAGRLFNTSRYVFVFMTPNFVNADLERFLGEIALLQTITESEKKERLIPIRTEKKYSAPAELLPIIPLSYHSFKQAKENNTIDKQFSNSFNRLIVSGRERFLNK